jgi:hypothetical protein
MAMEPVRWILGGRKDQILEDRLLFAKVEAKKMKFAYTTQNLKKEDK